MEPADFWSRISAELKDEIIEHNADDVPTVCAMSLVSKKMRSSAITHLCSVIHFACVEEFSLWLDMLKLTPKLETTVKKVKFSNTESWVRRHRGLPSVTKLTHAPVPPIIPSMPNVRVVDWDPRYGFDLTMAVAYMALFPSIDNLNLKDIFLIGSGLTNLIGACRNLKVLSLTREVGSIDFHSESEYDSDDSDDADDRSDEGLPLTRVHRPRFGPSPFDLTNLEELAVTSIYDPDLNDYLVQLLETSPPAALKSLSFGVVFEDSRSDKAPCSLTTIEKLLRLGAPSLINLAIAPPFRTQTEIRKVLETFSHLPAFPALDLFTIWLGPNRQAKGLINALPAALNLTTLTFRLIFNDYDEDYFNKILHTVFPWDASEPMKSVLTRKFPLIRRIRFHFCVPRKSDLHFRRGLRRSMERRLKQRLHETGADVEEYLEFAWLDDDYNLVTYRKTSGKPPWKSSWNPEPETEASDCESKNLDEDTVQCSPRRYEFDGEDEWRRSQYYELDGPDPDLGGPDPDLDGPDPELWGDYEGTEFFA